MPHAFCLDCDKPYADFKLDVVMPRAQWLAIHPADYGLLCANCIVRRAARLPGATVCHLIVEVAPVGAPDAPPAPERVHAIYWASQPDLQIHCTGVFTTPAWTNQTPPVYRTIEGQLYSFEREHVTCPACLALQGPPKAPPGRS